MDIQGKVALVTGAASGIGRASALRLGQEGASVVVSDIDEAGGREVTGEIEAGGGRAAFVRADVTSEQDSRDMMAFAEEKFGGVDILHNNAGIITRRPRFPEAEVERWSQVLDINLRGVILGTQLGIEALRKRGGGAIVNTASISALIGWRVDPVYAATKGGVLMFTASLASLKEEMNIRVNCVCPGIVDTPLLHRARDEAAPGVDLEAIEAYLSMPLIPAEEVADAVVEMIRDESLAGRAMRMMNGQPRALVEPPVVGPPPGT